MAYTYADFERAAGEAGLSDSFSDNDKSIAQRYPEYGLSLVSLRRDLNKATTNEQKLLATEAENQLRKNYGSLTAPAQGTQAAQAQPQGSSLPQTSSPATVSGSGSRGAVSAVGTGSTGTQSSATGIARRPAFSTTANAANPIGMQDPAAESSAAEGAEETPEPTTEHKEYTNSYQRLLDQAKTMQDFSFDPFTDPRYSAYKKAYNREGDRAAANALAQSAAATGGRPSSYSQVAAQEANNYYAAKLADAIPALYGEALDEYNSNYERAMANAEIRAQLGDFGGYADLYGPETAADMYAAWAAQNPDLAYLAGQLTPDQYANLAAGRPLNDGLDENGVRTEPIPGGGGGGWAGSTADILRNQIWGGYNSTHDANGNALSDSAPSLAQTQQQVHDYTRF